MLASAVGLDSMAVAVAAAILLTPFANAATKRAFVQVRGAAIETGSELSVRFGRANADGNLIVAYVVWDNPGAVALTDSSGGTASDTLAAISGTRATSMRKYSSATGSRTSARSR